MVTSGTGTAGSNFDGEAQNYPDFSKENFHQPPCPVNVSFVLYFVDLFSRRRFSRYYLDNYTKNVKKIQIPKPFCIAFIASGEY